MQCGPVPIGQSYVTFLRGSGAGFQSLLISPGPVACYVPSRPRHAQIDCWGVPGFEEFCVYSLAWDAEARPCVHAL